MPVRIKGLGGGRYRVTNGGKVVARATTKAKAASQARLLREIEHGYKPRRRSR